MVFCQYDKTKTRQCKKTGGKCILDNPKTVIDLNKCPTKKKIYKDYNDMNDYEKLRITVNKRNMELFKFSKESKITKKALDTITEDLFKYGVKFKKLEKKLELNRDTTSACFTALQERIYMLENGKKLRRIKQWWNKMKSLTKN